MGRRRAARTVLALGAPQGRALSPLTPSDLVKNVPRNFATLWVGADPAAAVAAAAEKERGVGGGRREGGTDV